jgi:hypothetical protein
MVVFIVMLLIAALVANGSSFQNVSQIKKLFSNVFKNTLCNCLFEYFLMITAFKQFRVLKKLYDNKLIYYWYQLKLLIKSIRGHAKILFLAHSKCISYKEIIKVKRLSSSVSDNTYQNLKLCSCL